MDVAGEMSRMRQLGRAGYELGEEYERSSSNAWVPVADIFARGDDVVIRIELAGVGMENIEVTLSGGVLVISGERADELTDQTADFYVRERHLGAFRRSLTLPDGIDESDVSADFDNGLVTIVVRNGAAAEEPKRILLSQRSNRARR